MTVQEYVNELRSRYYRIEITADSDGWSAEAWAGDTNCPHPGRYNPDNGHGWQAVETQFQHDTLESALEELLDRVNVYEAETPMAQEAKP